MAFFGIPASTSKRAPRARVSEDFLHRHECAVCPLNNQSGLRHPHMKPTGSLNPLAYFLGEAPGGEEDRKGAQFVGPAGRILRHHLPARWLPQTRFNNCVRTRPPDNRTPTYVELECCRPSVESDVLKSGARAIVGFGNVPLSWAGVAETGITLWTGRRVPVLVAGRPLWFFPVVHPSAIQRDEKWRGLQRPGRYGSELEFQFALHLRRALGAIEAGLPEPSVHSPQRAREGVEWVDGSGGDSDLDRVVEHLCRAGQRKVAGIDYETSCLRPYSEGAKVLTVSVSTLADGTLAFPLDHRESRWSRRQRAAVDEAWRDFLYGARCRKVAHHLAFEMEWSARFYGPNCLRAGVWGDSLAQAYVLDERPGAHNLDFLVKQYFGLAIKQLVNLDMSNLDGEPLRDVLPYNGMDSKYGLLLYLEQARALREAGIQALYCEHLERVPTAVLTQLKGVPVSQVAVLRLGKKYTTRMAAAQEALRVLAPVKKFERTAGQQFRPSANEDVMRVCRSLGYHPDNVDEEALEKLDHEFAVRVLEWRKAAKIYGTYVMPTSDEKTRAELEAARRAALQRVLGPTAEFKEISSSRIYPDGAGHPQTNVNRTRTSRTSSDDWNYQNWPKRGAADAIEVRGIIRPVRADEVVVSFDYGQIQARNVGMESLDRGLIDAFWSDYDIHRDFMEHLVRIYPRWVKEGARVLARDPKLQKKYRNDVKHGFVFARFFGAGAKKTAGVLGVPISAAEELDEIFTERFGGIPAWHAKLEQNYYRDGYVTGHSGYRRWVPVSYNERINSPIQADETKIVLDAMTRLSKIDHNLLQPIMEIHDDLTFIWPKKKIDELAPVVVREMLSTPFEWAKTTPIVVEMAVGPDWATLEEVEVFASNRYDGIDMPRSCPI